MTHPALTPGSVAVVTGGAAGIGLAAAKRFAGLGLRVVIADLGADRLAGAAEELAALSAGGADDIMALETDVSRVDEVRRLEAAVRQRFGGTDVLMNNAGIQPGSGIFGPAENWQRVIAVNLWGVIHGVQVFVPVMLARKGSRPHRAWGRSDSGFRTGWRLEGWPSSASATLQRA